MALLWASEYDGVPPAEAFSSTGGLGTPIIVNFNTGIAYYYKAGTGVQAINSPSASGISDHGGLTGLGDDDHTQYHNDARGDARYAPIAHVGAGGTAHSVATTSTAGFLSSTDKARIDALDEWTYLILGTDLSASTATPQVSPLAFTPDADAQYIVEAHLIIETSDPAIGPCPGVSWPSGLTFGAAELRAPTGSTTQALLNATGGTSARVEVPSLPFADTPYLALLSASFLTGGSPSGDFAVTISSEA